MELTDFEHGLVAGMRWPGVFKDAAAQKQLQDWYDAGLLTSPDNPVRVTESLLFTATAKPVMQAKPVTRGGRTLAVDLQFVDVVIRAAATDAKVESTDLNAANETYSSLHQRIMAGPSRTDGAQILADITAAKNDGAITALEEVELMQQLNREME